MAADRVYDDFEPFYDWARGDRRFTVMLPGYTRNQLKIRVTSKPALKLMGERLIFGNRWRRFNLEFPIPPDYDTNNVTATFEGGKLSVTFAKLVKPQETTNPPEEAPRSKEPSQKVDEQIAAKEGTPKATEEKTETEPRTNESDQKALPADEQIAAKEDTPKAKEEKTETEPRTNESDQKALPADEQIAAKEDTPKAKEEKAETEPRTNESDQKTLPVDEQIAAKEATPKAKEEKAETEPRTNESDQKTLPEDKEEPKNETEKSKTETAASIDKVAEEVKTNRSTEITEAPKPKGAKSVARSKTRLVDFTVSNQNENEASGDLAAWLNKWKKLVKLVLLSLLVVGLGLYSRNAFRSSRGEWNFSRVVTSLLKYFY